MTVRLRTIALAGLLAILLCTIFGLDDWLGILAFKYRYLAFCLLVAGTVSTAWLANSRKCALTLGLSVFALLMTPFFMSEPSSRILRGVLIDVQPGTHGDEIEEMVWNAYSESVYVMPRITRSDKRIHVSLLTQEPGDCTAAIFYLADGVVVNAEFSAD